MEIQPYSRLPFKETTWVEILYNSYKKNETIKFDVLRERPG